MRNFRCRRHRRHHIKIRHANKGMGEQREKPGLASASTYGNIFARQQDAYMYIHLPNVHRLAFDLDLNFQVKLGQ